jgi:NADH-quinone oxidoreductase subunit H
MFMIGELANIVLMCAMLTILFFGGWHSPLPVEFLNAGPMPVLWFCLKVVFFFFLFAMVKAIVPRYRYDQLMRIGWKIFLPLSLFWVVLVSGILIVFPSAADYLQSWRY